MQREQSPVGSRWKSARNRWKAAIAIGAIAVVAVACYDATRPVDVADQSPAAAASSASPGKTRRVNRMAHVGQLHNRMMDAYLKDLKRQSRLYGQPCTGAAAWFATAPGAMAVRAGVSTEQLLDVVRDNPSRVRECSVVLERLDQARRKARARIIQTAYFSPFNNEDIPISDAAAELLTQIQAAMGQLTTADNLDDQLDPIIAAADGLGGSDAEAVLSYAAVASSSGHYWEENHATAALALLPVSEGGGCEMDCLTEGWETSWSPFPESRPPVKTVRKGPASPAALACLGQLVASTGGWGDVAKADMWGAIGAVALEKKWNPHLIGVTTALASGSQLSWHQLWLIGCYIFAM